MGNLVKQDKKFIEVQLSVLVFQEDDSYLAYCPALELSTYGDSVDDVKIAFDDLINAYIDDGSEMGTLEKDLRAHGWKTQINAGRAEPPTIFDLNIPAGMLRQQFYESFHIPVC